MTETIIQIAFIVLGPIPVVVLCVGLAFKMVADVRGMKAGERLEVFHAAEGRLDFTSWSRNKRNLQNSGTLTELIFELKYPDLGPHPIFMSSLQGLYSCAECAGNGMWACEFSDPSESNGESDGPRYGPPCEKGLCSEHAIYSQVFGWRCQSHALSGRSFLEVSNETVGPWAARRYREKLTGEKWRRR